MSAEESVKQIVSDILGVPEDRLGPETEMQNTPEWDSLRHMQLVLALEQNFGVGPLSAEDIVAMTSFANIASILDRAAGKRP